MTAPAATCRAVLALDRASLAGTLLAPLVRPAQDLARTLLRYYEHKELEEMDYDAIDRAASRYVVAIIPPNGGRLYLSVSDMATDVRERIRAFRDATAAYEAARELSADPAWTRFGFKFEPEPGVNIL